MASARTRLRGFRFCLTIGLAASVLAIAAVASPVESPARNALWLTVQACVADFKLTGAPFPCLMVDLTGGGARGYVILRSPFGAPDTILAPTRRIAGIEDPWLLSPSAPNYFEAAWRARTFVASAGGAPPATEDFALAVNSAFARSQDQFHIHLGCLAPSLKRRLPDLAARLPIGQWTRLGAAVAGVSFWALRTGEASLAGVEPLKLAAQGPASRYESRAGLALLVARVRLADVDETLILASHAGAPGPMRQASAENLLDPGCSDGTSSPLRPPHSGE
jgi:CDP-diacylglycerol pyrophosphatase